MTRNPVLLIHGIFRKSGVFQVLSAYLSALGWSVYAPDLTPNLGEIGIDELAQQLADYIDQTFAQDQKLNLVGLSMGGLVSRYYIQRLGGIDRVERLITISSPHQGTIMAYLLSGIGYVQMRPGSSFLQDLNEDVTILTQIDFTSIWTTWDFIIVPANSSQIAQGKDLQVEVFAHACMVNHPQSLQAIASVLSTPIRVYPQPE